MSRLALVLEVGERHLEATGGRPGRPQIRREALGVNRSGPGTINKDAPDGPHPLMRQDAMRHKIDLEIAQLLGLFDNMKPNTGDSDDATDNASSSSRSVSPVAMPREVVDGLPDMYDERKRLAAEEQKRRMAALAAAHAADEERRKAKENPYYGAFKTAA